MYPFFVHSLSYNELGPNGAAALAPGLAANGGLTVANVLYNQLDSESATMLVEAVKHKHISLCGIKPDQSSADFKPADRSSPKLQAPDAILLASDLSKPAVTGSLTSVRALL